jgi:predicted dehydrogenase
MPYRVGVIGTGGIARAHAGACKAVNQTQLAAICDVSEEALNRFGDEFGVQRRYPSAQAMLESERLDIVIISTWGASHAEISKLAAQTGNAKAILCEKPFCMNAEEAVEMVLAAKERGVLIAEAFKFRHHPQHVRAKEVVDSGALGEIRTIRSIFSIFLHPGWRLPSRNWRFNKAKGGGCIFDLGCYCVHQARFILGLEPERVFASTQMGTEVEEAADIVLVFQGNVVAHISASYNYVSAQFVEVYGTRGMLRIDPAWNNEGEAVELRVSEADGRATPYRFQKTNQFEHQIRHLCECLNTGRPNRIPPEDSIRQMRVLDAIFESAKTGQVVAVAGDK